MKRVGEGAFPLPPVFLLFLLIFCLWALVGKKGYSDDNRNSFSHFLRLQDKYEDEFYLKL